MQLHNAAIRNAWDRKYVELDALLAHAGITPDDPEFTPIVRHHIDQARDEIDSLYGQFFTEQRGEEDWSEAVDHSKDWVPGGHEHDGAAMHGPQDHAAETHMVAGEQGHETEEWRDSDGNFEVPGDH